MGRTYSDRGQLATLVYDGTTIDTRADDEGGLMTSSSYNNGVSESRTYNDDNVLAGISFTGASIDNLTYGWDEGNLSLVGDWNSITENATTQIRTHGPTHELVSVASQSVTPDAKGNMTLIPAALPTSGLQTPASSLSIKWDFENKLLAVHIDNDGTDDVFYKFDALGRRVARTANSATTVYFQSGKQTIADYTAGTAANSPTYNYVYASYIDETVMRASSGGSAKHYFHRNQQYSITAITDGSGGIEERYAYTAYGTPTITDASGTTRTTTAIGNRYTYTGRELDEALSLYHYRARMYDGVGGRFVSRDPIGYSDGWSVYRAYFIPRGTDAQGLSVCEHDKCVAELDSDYADWIERFAYVHTITTYYCYADYLDCKSGIEIEGWDNENCASGLGDCLAEVGRSATLWYTRIRTMYVNAYKHWCEPLKE